MVGRALRRQDTDNPGWHEAPSYADIFGVPFNYMLEPARPPPPKPPGRLVKANVAQDDLLALKFPMVTKYDMVRTSGVDVKLDEGRVRPYTPDEEVLEGVFGKTRGIDMVKCSNLQGAVYAIAAETVRRYADAAPGVDRGTLFTKMVPVVHRWLDLAVEDAEAKSQWLCSVHNMGAIVENVRQSCKFTEGGTEVVPRPVVNSVLSTKCRPYQTVVRDCNGTEESDRVYEHPLKCSHTAAAFDSALETRVARALDRMPAVKAWMRNHRRVGWCLPYYSGVRWRMYYPDFVARVDAGDGDDFFCIVEAKGLDSDDARAKAHYARDVWARAVNSLGDDRWAFVQVDNEGALAARIEDARAGVAKSP